MRDTSIAEIGAGGTRTSIVRSFELVHIDVTQHGCTIYRMSFVIRCGTPDCDWGKKMCDLGEEQLRLCYSEFRQALHPEARYSGMGHDIAHAFGNCFDSIPNLKNLPMRLRMSRMIAPSAPHTSGV